MDEIVAMPPIIDSAPSPNRISANLHGFSIG
jgi:hypothetical protein